MNWQQALKEAVSARDNAETAFLYAAGDYCDYAIYQLQAAEENVRLLVRQARQALGYDLMAAPPGRLTFPVALPVSNGLEMEDVLE
ncbi:MAG: hypothetical protein M0Z53_01250 [Thermaerobacter sp.]|nr:hypothetical protein [Thermaerobacter sp.]